MGRLRVYGLALGKNRTDTPLNIKWTNKNVETLDVYFGNADPAGETFDIRSMNCWKQISFM